MSIFDTIGNKLGELGEDVGVWMDENPVLSTAAIIGATALTGGAAAPAAAGVGAGTGAAAGAGVGAATAGGTAAASTATTEFGKQAVQQAVQEGVKGVGTNIANSALADVSASSGNLLAGAGERIAEDLVTQEASKQGLLSQAKPYASSGLQLYKADQNAKQKALSQVNQPRQQLGRGARAYQVQEQQGYNPYNRGGLLG